MKERGQYWLVVPHPAHCDIETVAKMVNFSRNGLSNTSEVRFKRIAAPTVQDDSARPPLADHQETPS